MEEKIGCTAWMHSSHSTLTHLLWLVPPLIRLKLLYNPDLQKTVSFYYLMCCCNYFPSKTIVQPYTIQRRGTIHGHKRLTEAALVLYVSHYRAFFFLSISISAAVGTSGSTLAQHLKAPAQAFYPLRPLQWVLFPPHAYCKYSRQQMLTAAGG